jgi:hypothetical protein
VTFGGEKCTIHRSLVSRSHVVFNHIRVILCLLWRIIIFGSCSTSGSWRITPGKCRRLSKIRENQLKSKTKNDIGYKIVK